MKSFPNVSWIGGSIVIQVIAFASISVMLLSGLVTWANLSVRSARQGEVKEQALHIAEAGIDYYRWHLAHAPTDYQDGTATPGGPYIHDYLDKNGVKIGEFALTIVPPTLGSTMVTVTASGTVLSSPDIHRVVRARLGKPSFAKYSVISNSDMHIGADIWGPMHSNGMVNLVTDQAHNVVTSAKTTGTTTWEPATQWAVWGNGDPAPPTSLTTTTATFLGGRDIGVPALDFAGITVDIQAMMDDTTPPHLYPQSGVGKWGYRILLQANDTYDIFRVDTIVATPGGGGCNSKQWWLMSPTACPNVPNTSWSISTETQIGDDVPLPANGLIFAQDHVWVSGTINGARLTIVAATVPDPGPGLRKNIIVNNDLRYTNYDGSDVIGLIAQDNFWVGLVSEEDLRIDAAILAQNGRVSRMFYHGCGVNSVKDNIYFYGMFATNLRYRYGYLNMSEAGTACDSFFLFSGYNSNRTYVYDGYLLYGPPPSFPATADNYEIISWDEI